MHDQDQDTTDFQKSLAWLRAFAPHITTVYVLGAPGGRFDHSMAAIHTLYMNSDIKMYLVSNESMAFLLLPGPRHVIQVDTQTQGPTCGLLPVGSEGVRMNTEGLKWNLDSSMPLQFGKLVSSSNAFDVSPSELTTRHSVLATTNKPVVFTVQIDLSKI